MSKNKCNKRVDEKAKAFIGLICAHGDKNVMAKLYDIFYWEKLSDEQALARTDLWHELEDSVGNSGKHKGLNPP